MKVAMVIEVLHKINVLLVSQERGKRKRGKPRMRWRDCIERDMRKAELEDVDWRMVAQDRGQWRRVVHRAAETCSHPHP